MKETLMELSWWAETLLYYTWIYGQMDLEWKSDWNSLRRVNSRYLSPFKNLRLILEPKFAWDFVAQIKDMIIQKLLSLSEAEIKNLDKNAV